MFTHFRPFPRRSFRHAALRIVFAAAITATLALPATAEDRAVKSKVAPVYPELAKRMRIAGTVTIEATVGPDGKVTATKTVSGNKTLGQAAEDAISKWRFVPGDAVSTVNIDITFGAAQ